MVLQTLLPARTRPPILHDPPIARALLADTAFAWIWLIIRVYVGWQWLDAGWRKLESPAWVDGGTALRAYWERAIQPAPGAIATFDWYRVLLQRLIEAQSYTWIAQLVAYGETLLGIALILGLFAGAAAFIGSVLSFNFTLAGSAAANPLLLALAVGLILAWKTAGWIGLDRWLLPALGVCLPSDHPLRWSDRQKTQSIPHTGVTR